MSVVKRVRAVFGVDDAQSQDDAAESAEQSTSREQRTTELFHCGSCGTTYVSREMESCSKCETPVESVPTEQDLGLL